MKSSPLFFFCLFAALGISLSVFVFGTNAQYGGLGPFADENEGATFPQQPLGLAARGLLVYQDLGCAACHTQQVRRADFGTDKERGWGERQSVARDYVYDDRVLLGDLRAGPDLTNFGQRAANRGQDAAQLMVFLHNGQGAMPAYPFLFSKHKIVGQPIPGALTLPGRPSYELVPTPRVQALAAYLLSLKSDHDYPETARPQPAAPGGEKK
ncbi:MAG TPA: cbb3-type cytochrome c oxidase subunit II [Opitutaceae bacterium]|nr:cbb3-type cytochrome c oxidase subunit II [Opitutaceae bacterium]